MTADSAQDIKYLKAIGRVYAATHILWVTPLDASEMYRTKFDIVKSSHNRQRKGCEQ